MTAAAIYTIAITLSPNTTGADRTAIITISCNGIGITVTQKTTAENGETPAPALKIVSLIDFYRYWNQDGGETITLHLNSDGYITSMENSNGIATFTYTNGYLQQITSPDKVEIWEGKKKEDGSISDGHYVTCTGTQTCTYIYNGV